jgi:hypothetical protein
MEPALVGIGVPTGPSAAMFSGVGVPELQARALATR